MNFSLPARVPSRWLIPSLIVAVAVGALTGEPAAANTCGSNIASDFNGDFGLVIA